MAEFTIYLANKNYSSWSLRGWLMLKQTGAGFDEVVIPLYQPDSHAEILRRAPSGKLPALVHEQVTVWESLAIGEYLAELFPAAGLWPKDQAARAHARTVATEMHAGFVPLRGQLPMNTWRPVKHRQLDEAATANVRRIDALWSDCRNRFG